MDNFCVPPSPAWYTSPVCTPENGLLYIAGNHTSIAYIPPSEQEDSSKPKPDDAARNDRNIQIIQTHNQLVTILLYLTNKSLVFVQCLATIKH